MWFKVCVVFLFCLLLWWDTHASSQLSLWQSVLQLPVRNPPSHLPPRRSRLITGVSTHVWSSEKSPPVSTCCSAWATLRTEGHWDNYKTMSRWKASPARRALELPPFPPPSELFLLLFAPPPQTVTREWHHQATPPQRELPLGNRGKGVQAGGNVKRRWRRWVMEEEKNERKQLMFSMQPRTILGS